MDKNLKSLLKEIFFILVIGGSLYLGMRLWNGHVEKTVLDSFHARSPNPRALVPGNIEFHGIGIERTIELLGGSISEGVE